MKISDMQSIKIRNIVCTTDLKQNVDIGEFNDYDWGTYDLQKYGGRCGYIKTPEMEGRVTVFATGKMISVGATTIEKSKAQILASIKCLTKAKLIKKIPIKVSVQNIVATTRVPNPISIAKASKLLDKSIYEPEQFPGLILKYSGNVCFLLFQSGNIVITGAKSKTELFRAVFELKMKLSRIFNDF